MIPDEHRDLLQGRSFAHIATRGPDGAPQSNPVWIDWDGEYVRFSQTKRRQKYANLQRDPRLALSIIDRDNPYHYLEVRGRMVDVEEDPDNAFIDKLASRYIGTERYPYHQPGEERVVIVVAPEHTTSMG